MTERRVGGEIGLGWGTSFASERCVRDWPWSCQVPTQHANQPGFIHDEGKEPRHDDGSHRRRPIRPDALLGTTVANNLRTFGSGTLNVKEVIKTAVVTCAFDSDLDAVIKVAALKAIYAHRAVEVVTS